MEGLGFFHLENQEDGFMFRQIGRFCGRKVTSYPMSSVFLSINKVIC